MRRVVAPWLEPAEIGDVDDGACGGSEVRCRLLRQQERRAQVQVENVIPLCDAGLGHRDALHHRGGVDEDVEPPEVVHDALWQRERRIGVAQVRAERNGIPPLARMPRTTSSASLPECP
jgi:hypothetical protein